jgi:hypothetical protein
MRASLQLNSVKAVLEVRRLQELAAEMAAAKAAAALRTAQDRREEGAQQLKADEEDWARAVADASLSLPVAALWANQVAQSQAALKEADLAADAAEQQKCMRSDEWSVALGRSNAAGKLARVVFRGARRVREEAVLNEIADRAGRSRLAP